MANIYVKHTGSNTSPYDTWAKAATTLGAAVSIATNADTIWVSQAHSQAPSTSTTWTFPTTPGLRILCGNDSAEPPTALAATASIVSATNAVELIFDGNAYVHGIIFGVGGGSSGTNRISFANAQSTPHSLFFNDCSFRMNGATSASSLFRMGPASGANVREVEINWHGCTLNFGASGQSVQLRNGRLFLQNCSLLAGATTPTSLFSFLQGGVSITNVSNCDFSAISPTNLCDNTAGLGGVADFIIRNSKLPSGINVVSSVPGGAGGPLVWMENCDSADTGVRLAHHFYSGSIVQETTLVRTGGAPISWKFNVASAAKFPYPTLRSPEIYYYNTTVGAALKATIHILRDSATNLKNDQIYLVVNYLGTSGFPKGLQLTDAPTTVITAAADQDSSSETWTTTGMSNPNKQKLEVTFTPQEEGYIIARVRAADLGGGNPLVYVCPKLEVTAA